MTLQKTTITPKMAAELIKKSNGKPDLDIVFNYAELMKSGEWLNDESDYITMDNDGKVLDGFHRLGAIVESGISQTMNVFQINNSK